MARYVFILWTGRLSEIARLYNAGLLRRDRGTHLPDADGYADGNAISAHSSLALAEEAALEHREELLDLFGTEPEALWITRFRIDPKHGSEAHQIVEVFEGGFWTLLTYP